MINLLIDLIENLCFSSIPLSTDKCSHAEGSSAYCRPNHISKCYCDARDVTIIF